MSSNKLPNPESGPPADMATPVISLKDLGQLIAREHSLAPGLYELVVQFKFGPGRLAEGGGAVSAMAITFGGMGLRPAEKESAMTIEVATDQSLGAVRPTRKARGSAVAKAVKKGGVRKAAKKASK